MKHKNQIVIIGAGGHGRVAADIAGEIGYDQIVFLDDMDVPGAAGKTEDFFRYIDDSVFFIAIGNSRIRHRIHNMLRDNNATVVSLIHPNAIISDDVKIGVGTIVMAGAVVNTGASIGESVIVNTCASVDHDCRVGDYAHISVGAHVCGTVDIGVHTWIGAGATVINNVDICSECIIGAGAVVIRNIDEPGTYVGVPARKS